MNLIVDESVDFALVRELRNKGITVLSITEDYQGVKDSEVLKISNDKHCLLITEDKDFGELVYRLKLEHFGIMLIRLSDIPRLKRIEIFIEIIESHFEKLENNFSVLTSRGLRIKTTR